MISYKYNALLQPITVSKLEAEFKKKLRAEEELEWLVLMYISQQLISFKSPGKGIDLEGVTAALKLLGVELTADGRGENEARFDREKAAIEWHGYTYANGKKLSKIITTVTSFGTEQKEKPLYTEKKTRHRKAYSELSPELKKKLKKRYNWH